MRASSEQSVGAIILVRVMEVGEDLFEFAEEQRLRIGWHVAKVGKGQDELLRELLAGQCDVGLVDRDGLPHRLVQIVPLVVSAYEVVKCHKRVALPESLKDEGDLPTHLPVGDQHAFHDFGGHESQADCNDGLRVLQQREGLRIVHAGTNEELDVIADSMDLLWGQTSALKTHGLCVKEGGGNGSERIARGIDHGDRRVVREGAQTIAGLGRCEGPSKRPLVRGWIVDGAPVTRCGIHGAGTALARRHGCRTACER